jgi:hypothetical protein
MSLCPKCREESVQYTVAKSAVTELIERLKDNTLEIVVCSRCGDEFDVEDAKTMSRISSNDSDTESESAPTNFPTRELTLEEARRRYDDEERRRANVESKIGTVVTIDALIVSLTGIFRQQMNLSQQSLILVVLPAMISAAVGLWVLRTRDYGRPGKKIEDFHEYAGMTHEQQVEKQLLDYEVATSNNRRLTDRKYGNFDLCVLLTALSLILLLTIPFADEILALI